MKKQEKNQSFERVLSTPMEDIELELRGHDPAPWADFLLNPRRLRGSDFLMRWSQGVWSERRIVQAINETGEYFALPYGPSGVAPKEDLREFELYFERLDQAGLGNIKRPDLFVFQNSDRKEVEEVIQKIGDLEKLPFTPEEEEDMQRLISKAIMTIECENSLWKASKMPYFGSKLRPMKRLGGLLGLPKTAVLPTVIVKEEDRKPLKKWQDRWDKEIHIWQVFYDMAFGMSLNTVEELITSGKIEPNEQVFQAPGGATTKKTIYKLYYQYAYKVGVSKEEPKLLSDHLISKSGHILPYVKFEGGRLELSREVLQLLADLSTKING